MLTLRRSSTLTAPLAFASFLLLTLASSSAFAGKLTWTTWEFADYGLSFEMPDTMEIVQNDETGLMAIGENTGYTFIITIWNDATVESEQQLMDVFYTMMEGATDFTVDDYFEAEFGGGGTGYIMYAQAKFEGEWVKVGLASAIDPNSDRNFIAITVFQGDGNDEVESRMFGSLTFM